MVIVAAFDITHFTLEMHVLQCQNEATERSLLSQAVISVENVLSHTKLVCSLFPK